MLCYRVLSSRAYRKQITFTCSSYFLSYFYGASHRHLVGLPITILSMVVWLYLYIHSCLLCMWVYAIVWEVVWVSTFVLFLSWKRAIIAQPNITDLILDRTTEWPQSNGEWWMANGKRQLDFSNKLVYFAIASRRNIIPKFMRHASSRGGGYDFKFCRHWLWLPIRYRHPHRLAHRHPHRCLLILWWRQKISFLAAHSHSLPDSQPDAVHNAAVPCVLIIIGIQREARLCILPSLCCEFSLAPVGAFLLHLALFNFPMYGAYAFRLFVA